MDPIRRENEKNVGMLDMMIAFDTTGSMAQYIDAVRKDVAELIPQLFKDNEDLRLGIVAFGDYCDMMDAHTFGDAYQCMPPTDNANDLIRFVAGSKDTSGGDCPEFYELVLRRRIAELLPVVYNAVDWRQEARKAAQMHIKVDTVTITSEPWFRELSEITNGISVPFKTVSKTVDLLKASVLARGSLKARFKFDSIAAMCSDMEMLDVFDAYKKERDSYDDEFE